MVSETLLIIQASVEQKLTRKQKWQEKQLYENFKRQTKEISHEKTWIWLSGVNLKREHESLLITAQNNAIKINYIKSRIDKTQQISNCKLYIDRYETINQKITECRKLAQKEYKSIRKLILWEGWKKFKFDLAAEWYMHKPKSVPENETYKILWDSEIQTDHVISARRPDKEVKNLWTVKVMAITIVIGAFVQSPKEWYWEKFEIRQVETIQTTALLRSAGIQRRFLEIWADLQSLKLHWKTISWFCCEILSKE